MSILGDFISIKHGFAFKGEGITTEDNGVVLVTPGNFSIGGGFKEDKCKFFVGEYPTEYVVSPDDLIVTMTDLSKEMDTLGYSALVPDTNRVYLHNQRIGLIRILNDGLDKHFLYWFMRTRNYQRTIAGGASGTTVHHTSPNRICEVEVDFPNLATQKRIASVLDNIELKIGVNAKINQNLYDQIQAIYCKDFDPVSHEVTGVLSDICKFSTDKVQISDLSVSTYYSTENMQPNKAGAVDASSLPSISQTTRCRKGNVLISNIRPYFKKIVYVTEDCGCSTDVLCFVPQSDYSAFLFGTLYMDRFFDYMVAGAKGTKMPRGDKQQIMKYPIVIPKVEELFAFNAAVTPMLKHITINNKEIAHLATMRDALLPRIMSGELDVSKVEV